MKALRSQVPKLCADLDSGEGHIILPDGWDELDGLMHIDLLSDWIYDLQMCYEAERQAFFYPKGPRAEEAPCNPK